jgi:hypothetical protein
MNTYTWSIKSLDTKNEPQPNTVYNINFKVTATDGVNTASWECSNALEFTEQSEFSEYNNLTQAQVLFWLTDTLGQEGVSAINAHMDYLLGTLSATTQTTLPWAQGE